MLNFMDTGRFILCGLVFLAKFWSSEKNYMYSCRDRQKSPKASNFFSLDIETSERVMKHDRYILKVIDVV